MIWIIIVLGILLFFSLTYNYNMYTMNKYLSKYWEDTENEKWLEMMRSTGCEMVNLNEHR